MAEKNIPFSKSDLAALARSSAGQELYAKLQQTDETQLRRAMETKCGALFAPPRYSTDNAMGTAILTWRAMEREGRV